MLASIADVLTTRAGIRSGMLHEANPLMRWATRTTLRSLSVKALGIAIAVALWPHVVLLWVAALWTGWLAWSNYRLLRAVQRS